VSLSKSGAEGGRTRNVRSGVGEREQRVGKVMRASDSTWLGRKSGVSCKYQIVTYYIDRRVTGFVCWGREQGDRERKRGRIP